MRYCFVMTAENRSAFRNMVRLLVWSIRHRAGALSNAGIFVVYNDSMDEADAAELARRFDVRVAVMPRVDHPMGFLNKYNALKLPGLDSIERVIYLDCDTAVIGPLDELDAALGLEPGAFAAVPVTTERVWGLDSILADLTELSIQELERLRHPWHPHGLPYFNSGFFTVPGPSAATLGRSVVDLAGRLFDRMRASGAGPMHWARIQWNRRVWRTPWADRLVIPPFLTKYYAEQTALGAAAIAMGLPILPLAQIYNWHLPDHGAGPSDPIRILHYMNSLFPIDRDELFSGAWIAPYESSACPGKRALADLVRAYNRASSADASHRAER